MVKIQALKLKNRNFDKKMKAGEKFSAGEKYIMVIYYRG